VPKECKPSRPQAEGLDDQRRIHRDVRRDGVVRPEMDPGVARPQRQVRLDQPRAEEGEDDEDDREQRVRQRVATLSATQSPSATCTLRSPSSLKNQERLSTALAIGEPPRPVRTGTAAASRFAGPAEGLYAFFGREFRTSVAASRVDQIRCRLRAARESIGMRAHKLAKLQSRRKAYFETLFLRQLVELIVLGVSSFR
jgi:hypothetical protein